MEELITLSIGLGLVISFVFSEALGLAAGGMVVPGYVAIYLNHPLLIIITLATSYLTYFIVHSLSAVMIIYGRRRTVLMILVGFALGAFLRTTPRASALPGAAAVSAPVRALGAFLPQGILKSQLVPTWGWFQRP